MTNQAILAFAALLVFAYLLDILGRRLRLPAVILLILTGMGLRQAMDAAGLRLDWVDPMVPVIGTIGLVLIVLEGALDLRLAADRRDLILRATVAAIAGFAACVALFAMLFTRALGMDPYAATLAAIPFAVISSAVAIPSANGLGTGSREFVTYESSISDIVGVLVFYAWVTSGGVAGRFAEALLGGGLVSLVVAAVAAVGLLYLINRVVGHVRFLPLLAGLLLVYAVGKELHLSPLVLVLVCGLLLNNARLLSRIPHLGRLLQPGYDDTLAEFKGLVAELTFAVRSFFFLLLGYWTEIGHMRELRAAAVAAAIVVAIYLTRRLLLALLVRQDAGPLTWLAPRGLITVLLFLGALETGKVDAFPFGAVMIVVLVTAALTGLAHRGRAPVAAPGEAVPVPVAAPGSERVADRRRDPEV
ncbi:MAG: hypothetical protein U1F08_10265 [Steroidobacteraceae bacterium]